LAGPRLTLASGPGTGGVLAPKRSLTTVSEAPPPLIFIGTGSLAATDSSGNSRRMLMESDLVDRFRNADAARQRLLARRTGKKREVAGLGVPRSLSLRRRTAPVAAKTIVGLPPVSCSLRWREWRRKAESGVATASQ